MSDFKLAMVTASSKIDDSGYLFLAWQGVKAFREKFGVTLEVIEADTPEQAHEEINYLGVKGVDLIWLVGHGLKNVGVELARRHHFTQFAFMDVKLDACPENAMSVSFREDEASFLAGVAAGKLTQSRKVGFVGGIEIESVLRFRDGFFNGCRYSNPGVETFDDFTSSFLSYEKGRESAKKLFKEGCDVIAQNAGAAGKGAIREAKLNNVWVVGSDMDQSYLASDNVLTSVLKKIDKTIYMVTEGFMSEKLYMGKNNVFGWKDGSVGLAPLNVKIPQDVKDFVEAARKDLEEGKITIV